MSGTLARIKKRDGEVTDFVQDKITTAIYKAMESKDIKARRAAQSVEDALPFVGRQAELAGNFLRAVGLAGEVDRRAHANPK